MECCLKFVICIVLLCLSSFVQAEVNFNFPTRVYINENADWNIFYEAEMKRANPKLAQDALVKLSNTLKHIESQLPASSISKLKTVKIFLLWGEKSSFGGLSSGMRYVRKGETKFRQHYDKRWENGIVIYSAENLMYLDALWSRKAITHEFAHAWHILHWSENHHDIVTPWQQAKTKNLYRKVKDYKGRVKQEAYALQNNLEYFAELSAIYFVGGDYFPYTKEGLTKYDPSGVKMVKKLWGVKD